MGWVEHKEDTIFELEYEEKTVCYNSDSRNAATNGTTLS